MSLYTGPGWIDPREKEDDMTSKHKIILDKKTGKPKSPAPRMAAGQRKNAEGKASSLAKRWALKSRSKA